MRSRIHFHLFCGSLRQRRGVKGRQRAYVFEVGEEIGDGFPLRVGEDIIVVDFGAACE